MKHPNEEVRINVEVSFVLTKKGANAAGLTEAILQEIRAHIYETFRGDTGPGLVTGVIANEVTGR